MSLANHLAPHLAEVWLLSEHRLLLLYLHLELPFWLSYATSGRGDHLSFVLVLLVVSLLHSLIRQASLHQFRPSRSFYLCV